MIDAFFRILAFAPLILIGSFSSCADPSYRGYVPPTHSQPWSPPLRPIYSLSCQTIDPAALIQRKNLNLSDLLDFALEHNPRTAQSWALARSAAYSWYVSASPYYPLITDEEILTLTNQKRGASITNSSQDGSVVSAGGITNISPKATYNQYITHDLTISYLLLDFGGRDANFEATRQALLAADWLHNRVLQDVSNAVMQTYYTYLQTDALLKAKQEQLKEAATSTEAAKAQFDAGVVNKIDYLLAKTNLVNVELQLQQLIGQLKINMAQVIEALGIPAETVLDLAPLPRDLHFEDITKSIDELLEIAMLDRPDLAAAYAKYYQAKKQVAIAYSAGLPTLNLLSNFEKVNNIHNPRANGFDNSLQISLQIPIFAGFFYENTVRKAKEDLAFYLSNIEILQQTISLQVVANYYAFKTAVQTVKSSDELLQIAQESYNAASLNYRSGVGSILDLLTAQTALANARAQLIDAQTLWISSLANIAYATGEMIGGVQE